MRIAYQYSALIINLIILLSVSVGFVLRPDKRPSLILWIIYGLIGAGFYVTVLFFDMPGFGNTNSPLRSLLQDALVAASLFFLAFDDLRKRWRNR